MIFYKIYNRLLYRVSTWIKGVNYQQCKTVQTNFQIQYFRIFRFGVGRERGERGPINDKISNTYSKGMNTNMKMVHTYISFLSTKH